MNQHCERYISDPRLMKERRTGPCSLRCRCWSRRNVDSVSPDYRVDRAIPQSMTNSQCTGSMGVITFAYELPRLWKREIRYRLTIHEGKGVHTCTNLDSSCLRCGRRYQHRVTTNFCTPLILTLSILVFGTELKGRTCSLVSRPHPFANTNISPSLWPKS